MVMPQKDYDREAISAQEAVTLIYNNYIKNEVQVDPILFDLFVNFLKDIKKEDVDNPFDN